MNISEFIKKAKKAANKKESVLIYTITPYERIESAYKVRFIIENENDNKVIESFLITGDTNQIKSNLAEKLESIENKLSGYKYITVNFKG